jgi:DNA-binding YbaB/EbfC family protein
MDIKSLMKQAQQMQDKMKKMQDDFSGKEFTGSAGGGLVKVLINGAAVAKKISIDPSLIVIDEKEVLEDLIIAAFNDAKKNADDQSSDMLKSATAGMPLPPGLKF